MAYDVHIGKCIQAEMERQGRKATWLAEQLFCDRTNIYKIYKRKSINTEQLQKICQALQFDFFALCATQSAENGV